MRSRLLLAGPRAARGPLALLAAIAAILALAGPVTLALARGLDDAGAARVLAELPVPERGLAVTTRTGDDPDGQFAAAQDVFAALPGAPALRVLTQRLTYPLASAEPMPGSGPSSVLLMATDDLAAAVRLTAGALPAPRAGSEALEVVAPAAAGLAVGDELALGDRATPVVVVGLWEMNDDDDAPWFGDPGIGEGIATAETTGGASARGPLLVADGADLLPTVDRARQRWILLPDPEVAGGAVASVGRALEVAPDRLRDAGAIVQGSGVTGSGPATFAALGRHHDQVAARGALASALVIVAAGIGLLATGPALARALGPRTRLLRARGARGWQVALVDAPGILAAAGAGALLGWAGTLAAPGAGGWEGAAARWALGSFLATALATLILTRRRLAVDRRRPGLAPAIGWTLLVVATALAAWRLLTGGLVTSGGTPARADLAAAFALPLTLAVAGALSTLVVQGCASLAVPLARRGMGALLTLRRLQHHPRRALSALSAVTGGSALLALRTARGSGHLGGGLTDPLGGPLAAALLCALAACAALTAAAWLALAADRRLGVGVRVARGAAIGLPRRTARASWIAGDLATLAIALAVGVLVAAAGLAAAPDLLPGPFPGAAS